LRYPFAIETGDGKRAFGVVVPDLPGCFSAGDTLDDALIDAHARKQGESRSGFPARAALDAMRKPA
jgi:hypothetical protein